MLPPMGAFLQFSVSNDVIILAGHPYCATDQHSSRHGREFFHRMSQQSIIPVVRNRSAVFVIHIQRLRRNYKNRTWRATCGPAEATEIVSPLDGSVHDICSAGMHVSMT